MRKTDSQRKKQLTQVLSILETVCHNPIKVRTDKDDPGCSTVFISQYDLDKAIHLEAAGAVRITFHTHQGFKQPEEIEVPRDKYNPVYLNIGFNVR